MSKPTNPAAPTPIAISIDDIPASVRKAAFGNGRTFEETMREQMRGYLSGRELDAMISGAINEMAKAVAKGEMIPILSHRGIVGYHPNEIKGS